MLVRLNVRIKVHGPGDCPEQFYGSGCDGYASYTIDPFAQEIYGETVWRWMCSGDYTGRAMDI